LAITSVGIVNSKGTSARLEDSQILFAAGWND